MTLLDTHIWLWWVAEDERLAVEQRTALRQRQADGLGVSVFSCWEIAKLAEKGRLVFDRPVLEWIDSALAQPDMRLFGLTPQIAVEATRLPGDFHRDPADQIIVATARIHDCPLLTADTKILAYPHVKLAR